MTEGHTLLLKLGRGRSNTVDPHMPVKGQMFCLVALLCRRREGGGWYSVGLQDARDGQLQVAGAVEADCKMAAYRACKKDAFILAEVPLGNYTENCRVLPVGECAAHKKALMQCGK